MVYFIIYLFIGIIVSFFLDLRIKQLASRRNKGENLSIAENNLLVSFSKFYYSQLFIIVFIWALIIPVGSILARKRITGDSLEKREEETAQVIEDLNNGFYNEVFLEKLKILQEDYRNIEKELFEKTSEIQELNNERFQEFQLEKIKSSEIERGKRGEE